MSNDTTRTRISASATPRLKACPGSLARSKGLDSISGPDAARGDRIHAALSARSAAHFVALEHADEEDCADRCWGLAVKARLTVFPDCSPIIIVNEERLYGEVDGEQISGKPDLVYRDGATTLVLDYKTGWGDQDESDTSMQLATLAWLVAENYAVDTVYVAMIQPAAGDPAIARYTRKDLDAVFCDLIDIVNRASSSHAPIVPGNHCQYCPAFQHSRCREAISAGLEIAVKAESKTKDAVALDMARLTGEELGFIARRLKLAKMAVEVATSEIKTRLANGEAVLGCSLKQGRRIREFESSEHLWESCLARGWSREFIVSAKVMPAALEAEITKVVGKQMAAEIVREFGVTETYAADSLEVES